MKWSNKVRSLKFVDIQTFSRLYKLFKYYMYGIYNVLNEREVKHLVCIQYSRLKVALILIFPCCSFLQICKQLWSLDSPKHLISELEVSFFMLHLSVENPVHTKIIYENLAQSCKNLPVSYRLLCVFFWRHQHAPEAVEAIDIVFSVLHIRYKPFQSDAIGINQGNKIRHGQVRNSKGWDGSAEILDDVFGFESTLRGEGGARESSALLWRGRSRRRGSGCWFGKNRLFKSKFFDLCLLVLKEFLGFGDFGFEEPHRGCVGIEGMLCGFLSSFLIYFLFSILKLDA